MMEYEFTEITFSSNSDVSIEEPLYNTYFKLTQILYALEDLKYKGKFNSQELGHLQNKLHVIDEQYHEAVIKKSGKIPAGQAVISELLEEVHELAHELACRFPDGEPTDTLRAGLFKVDESLRGIYIKLLKTYDDLDDLSCNEGATLRDLVLLQNRLNGIDQLYNEAAFHKGGVVPEGQAIVAELLEKCHEKSHDVALRFETAEYNLEDRTGLFAVDKSLRGLYAKLLSIVDAFDDLKAMGYFTTRDVGRLQNKLSEIDQHYRGAAFNKGGEVPVGQAILVELLEKAHSKAHEMVELAITEKPQMMHAMPESMQRTYIKLLNIVDALESLRSKDEITTRDIGALQNKLNVIDHQYREAAVWKSGHVPAGQALVAELLNEAREMVHDILCSLPPIDADVDESLRGTYYRLSSIIDSFKLLKEIGSFSSKDVGHLQLKLGKIDDQWKQAAIKKSGIIPRGQAIISEMINEAHDLAHELVCLLPEDSATPSEEYFFIEEELTSLIQALAQLHQKPYLRRAEVAELHQNLRAIENEISEQNIDSMSINMKINQAYGLVYEMIIELGPKKDLSSEIDESLWPIETELKKVIHALHELRKKPIKHLREQDLRYAQDKLRDVDELYSEGAFAKLLPTQDPLKGQAVLSSMLNKAHTMLYELECRLPEEPGH